MADYTRTSANVVGSSSAVRRTGTAGAAITAGNPVYIDTANNNVLKPADANLSALGATVAGIAENGGATGQPITYITEDPDFTHGLASPAAGDVIVLSSTAGECAPAADIASGWYPVVLGVAKSSTKMVLKPIIGTAAK